MIRIKRTDSDDEQFIALVKMLDDYLSVIDGDEHSFYAQYNKLDKIKHVIIILENDEPVACGGMKEYASGTMEIKRMFTLPAARGKGLAGMVLKELEQWAKDLSYSRCILETGKRMSEAVKLYPKNGYRVIENYGQYAGVGNSICFEKRLDY